MSKAMSDRYPRRPLAVAVSGIRHGKVVDLTSVVHPTDWDYDDHYRRAVADARQFGTPMPYADAHANVREGSPRNDARLNNDPLTETDVAILDRTPPDDAEHTRGASASDEDDADTTEVVQAPSGKKTAKRAGTGNIVTQGSPIDPPVSRPGQL